MSPETGSFTKENLDNYLKELAKEYRKLTGKSVRAEIILVGGGAVLANYGFREMTNDIDAVIHAASSMKDAINRVGDKYSLSNGWINTDFTETRSYSDKLEEYSVYYRTFSNVVEVRTMSAEYLIAMKLRSGRQYKSDLSDIAGILAEHSKRGEPINLDMIKTAYENLYGSWDDMPAAAGNFIEDIMAAGDYGKVYKEIAENEKLSRNVLINIEKNYPGSVNADTAQNILASLKEKKQL